MKNTTPAVLVYYEDILAGTDYMTDEEFGQYVRLLFRQNVVGHMSKEYLERVHLGKIFPCVRKKFVEDEDGKLFNIRMEDEIMRRVKYSESRSQNRKSEATSTSTSSKRFKPPTAEEVREYVTQKGYNVNPEAFVSFYTSKDWMVGKNKMKDWQSAVRGWHSRNKSKSQGRNEVLEMLLEGDLDDS